MGLRFRNTSNPSRAKGKLPAFLFYPKDWLTDPALLMCSRQARSVWIDMLCLMFFAPIRGVCATGERSWSDQEIAAALGGDIGTNMECIAELLAKGVAQRDSRGAIFSRRLVRDDQERRATAERVRKHRSACNASVTVDVTPLYGTATGNGTVTEIQRKKIPESKIVSIYNEYPRKVARADAFKAIDKAIHGLDSGEDSPPDETFDSIDDAIVYLGQRVKLFASTPAGQAGEFTPHPATWFNKKRYLDDDAEWQRKANGRGSVDDKWDAFARKHAAD